METYRVGETITYNSNSQGPVLSKIVMGPYPDGTFDLDCKQRVNVDRMSRPLASITKTSAEASTSSEPVGPLIGDYCFYNSASRGWIAARVLCVRQVDHIYDLDCKELVTLDQIFTLVPGSRVQYCSSSLNQWVPTRIIRKGHEPGMYDLDCKPGVWIASLRPDIGNHAQLATKNHPLGGPSLLEGKMALLRKAMALEDFEGLKKMIPEVVAAGGPQEEVNTAQAALRSLEAQSTRQTLQKARAERDIEAFKKTLEFAAYWSVLPPEEVDAMRGVLCVMEGRHVGLPTVETTTEPLQSTENERHKPDRQQSQKNRPRLSSTQAQVQEKNISGSKQADKLAQVRSARSNLVKAMEGNDLSSLTRAVESAVAVGLSEHDLQAARRMVTSLQNERQVIKKAFDNWRSACRMRNMKESAAQTARAALSVELRNAEATQDVHHLRAALSAGIKANLPQQELAPAQQLLQMLERRTELIDIMRTAVSAGDAHTLQKCIDDLAGTGAAAWQVNALMQELQTASSSQLRAALLHPNSSDLQKKMEVATTLGITGEVIDRAGHALWALEARPAAERELRRAANGQDVPALQAAIDAGAAVGVSQGDLANAAQALKDLKAKESARHELRIALSDGSPDKLRSALQYAERAGGGLEDSELAPARTALQKEELRGPGLATQILGPSPSKNAGLMTRVLGPAPCKDAGFMTRVFGHGLSNEGSVVDRMFNPAAIASGGNESKATCLTTQQQLLPQRPLAWPSVEVAPDAAYATRILTTTPGPYRR